MVKTEQKLQESLVKPIQQPRQYVSKVKGTIRCADCAGDFKTQRAFELHECEQQPFNFDYAVGTNL